MSRGGKMLEDRYGNRVRPSVIASVMTWDAGELLVRGFAARGGEGSFWFGPFDTDEARDAWLDHYFPLCDLPPTIEAYRDDDQSADAESS